MPALAAVGALDAVLVALCALIITLGLYMLFRPLIEGALGSIPLIGGWVAQHTDSLLIQIYARGVGAAYAAVGPLADLLRRAAEVPNTLFRYAVETLGTAYLAVWRLRFLVLPDLERRSAEYARAVGAQVAQYAQQLAQQVAAQAALEVQQAVAYAQALAAQVAEYARQLAVAAEARSVARTLEAERYAQQLAQSSEAFTVDQVDRANRYAQQLAQQVTEYSQVLVRDAELLSERIGVQTQDYARVLERVAVDHADQVGAAAVAIAATATAAVGVRVKELEDSPCQRFCSPLGNLGQLLQGLEDAGLLAIALGVLEETRRDPRSVQRVLRQDFVPLVHEAAAGLGLGT